MDKQKQIEEMANLIHHTEFVDISGYEEEKIAEELLKYYQPKLPGNAVVLTKEEYEWLTCCFEKFEEIMNDIKEQAGKETAEKIYTFVNSFGTNNWERFKNFLKQFGVE